MQRIRNQYLQDANNDLSESIKKSKNLQVNKKINIFISSISHVFLFKKIVPTSFEKYHLNVAFYPFFLLFFKKPGEHLLANPHIIYRLIVQLIPHIMIIKSAYGAFNSLIFIRSRDIYYKHLSGKFKSVSNKKKENYSCTRI